MTWTPRDLLLQARILSDTVCNHIYNVVNVTIATYTDPLYTGRVECP